MVNLGIVGLGTVGLSYVESCKHLDDVTLTAVSDPSVSKGNAIADEYNAKFTTDVYDLISRDNVDAVVIASPTPFHFFQVRSAIEAGKHTLLEIPLVRTEQDADELEQLLSPHNDLVLTAGHSLRYYQEYQKIKEKVEEGSVGKPATIRLTRQSPHPRNWYSNFEASGGVVLDAMVHEFDFLHWCFGPAERIYCQSMRGRAATENQDYALATIKMQNGALAHVESSWCHYGQFILDVEIAGDKGMIHYNNQDSIPLQLSQIDWHSGGRRYMSESPVVAPAYHCLLQEFIRAITAKQPSPIPLQEAMQPLRMAFAALRSVETKKPVTLQTKAA